jgi:hypothetical protein
VFKNAINFIVLAALLPLVISCGDGNSNQILRDLRTNQAKWESLNVSDYQYEYKESCFCPTSVVAPRTVLVNANEVVSITRTDNAEGLRPSQYQTLTVDELFDRIRLEESRAESLIVEYDPVMGYPTLISVDGNFQIADDEYTISTGQLLLGQDTPCTQDFRPGLRLNVIDQADQSPMNCGLVATAEEGGFTEVVETNPTDCNDQMEISMLGERAGFYTLTVEKAGYQTQVVEDLGIGKDLCHVITREVTLELTSL